ncbi:hypothetical protein AAFF_G00261690 [Aldrovandia affinis]|uniref:C-type lectin domain-containing protein n=1 Tax=Aldrovandia affinis TaxID=143900 RepID=A0AAD7RC27_9TELE|nr:hypothetical protein AAFF_G00261690 [Aldrovandia affinis]
MEHSVYLLLLFSGLFTLCSCLSHQYHFVNMSMNWTEAQSYCRENHTDLATVDNPEEMKRMMGVVGSDYVDNWAWIGLEEGTSSQWQWSLTDRGFYSERETEFRNWDKGKPDNAGGNESCAGMRRSGKWKNYLCNSTNNFICYDEQVQHWVNRRAQSASTAHVWLGLRFSCAMKFWFWVSVEDMCYRNWAPGNDTEECGHTGAVESGAGQQWVSLQETEQLNFICCKCGGI